MSRCEAPSPAPAPRLVFAEAVSVLEDTASTEDLLRKIIAEKMAVSEAVIASMESSIAEKERLIAENRATLVDSRAEIMNLRKQLAIIDTIGGGGDRGTDLHEEDRPYPERVGVPTPSKKVCRGVTRGWTKIEDHTAYINQGSGLQKVNADIVPLLNYPNMDWPCRQGWGRVAAEHIIKKAREYGGYITASRGECWIRDQTRNPNDLLKHMTPEKGSVVCISPGASIELIKKSGYECIWSAVDEQEVLSMFTAKGARRAPPRDLGRGDGER